MPLVVAAIEEQKWREALVPHLLLWRLPQTAETLSWFIDELERTAPSPGDSRSCDYLWRIVAAADVGLLRPHRDRLLAIAGPGYHKIILDRIRLDELSPADRWREAEEFCEVEKHTRDLGQVDVGQASRLVEAIGRDVASANRVMSLLAMEVEHVDGNPMTWMEGFAVGIAGEMRLTAAVPHLVKKLRADIDDWINDECGEALSKIGGDEVVEAVCQEFSSTWEFRLYAAPVLEYNRSLRVVARALDLYEQQRPRYEDDEIIVTSLLPGRPGQLRVRGHRTGT